MNMSATTRQRHSRSRRSRAARAQAWPATAAPAVPSTPVLHPAPEWIPVPNRAVLPPPNRHRVRQWLRAHWLSLLIVTGLLMVVGLVHAIGYDRFPGRINDD